MIGMGGTTIFYSEPICFTVMYIYCKLEIENIQTAMMFERLVCLKS